MPIEENRIDFSQLEHLHSKYTGTGNADTTRKEWLKSQKRDINAMLVGRPDLLLYTAIACGESTGRMRSELLESMVDPLRGGYTYAEDPLYTHAKKPNKE